MNKIAYIKALLHLKELVIAAQADAIAAGDTALANACWIRIDLLGKKIDRLIDKSMDEIKVS
jgi:hypothetical protein